MGVRMRLCAQPPGRYDCAPSYAKYYVKSCSWGACLGRRAKPLGRYDGAPAFAIIYVKHYSYGRSSGDVCWTARPLRRRACLRKVYVKPYSYWCSSGAVCWTQAVRTSCYAKYIVKYYSLGAYLWRRARPPGRDDGAPAY